MEKIILILRGFLAFISAWWYKISTKVFGRQIGPLTLQMGAIVAATLVLLGIGGCATTKLIPVENETIEKIVVRDSLVYRDSLIYVPQERVVEVVPQLDTLLMETELSEAKAYLDTSMLMLRGELKNKRATQKEYIERIEYMERTDTVYIERPQPYEVPEPYIPKWAWWSLIINIVTVLLVAFKLYLRFKP